MIGGSRSRLSTARSENDVAARLAAYGGGRGGTSKDMRRASTQPEKNATRVSRIYRMVQFTDAKEEEELRGSQSGVMRLAVVVAPSDCAASARARQ